MSTVVRTVEINAPVALVWQEVVCRTDRMHEWMPHVTAAELLTHRPDQIGSRARYHSELLGLERVFTNELTDVEDEKYLAYRSVAGNLSEHGYWRFEPSGPDGTRLTFFLEYCLPGGLLGRMVDSLLIHRIQEDRIAEGLHNLKRRCEMSRRLVA